METRYLVRKIVICLVFIALMLWGLGASAGYIYLDGSNLLAEPTQCRHNGKVYVCVPVEKDGVAYMILLDRKGEKLIYNISGSTPILVWDRDMI